MAAAHVAAARRSRANQSSRCLDAARPAAGRATTQLLDAHGHTAPQCTAEKGQPTAAELIGGTQHPRLLNARLLPHRTLARPRQHSTSLPLEIYQSAGRGELRRVARWLRREGRSMRSALQLNLVSPQPVAWPAPRTKATWRW